MLKLPVITHLRVDGYGLYPGKDELGILESYFTPGVTLIAGVNGLGKTTLITMLLRSLSGPYDLSGSGMPDRLESTLPSTPTKLKPSEINFFAQRVADGAKSALATLSLEFDGIEVEIVRSLASLSLEQFSIDGVALDLPTRQNEREKIYQHEMCALFNLSSFVDVLLVLHHIVFLTDRKTGALWDENAQRQILRAVFLDKKLARRIATTERDYQKAHSRYRNTRTQLSKFERQLRTALAKEASSPKIISELQATIKAMKGKEELLDALESEFEQADRARRSAVLDVEKAKIEEEEINGYIEQSKYTALLTMFPDMEASARLMLSRILSDEGCLVCGSEAKRKKAELNALLLNGCCPACSATREEQRAPSSVTTFQPRNIKKSVKKAEVAEAELKASQDRLTNVIDNHEDVLSRLISVRSEIDKLKHSESSLKNLLPSDSAEIKELKGAVSSLNSTMNEELAKSAVIRRKYGKALKDSHQRILDFEKKLSNQFAAHVKGLLAERARLVVGEEKAKVTQGGDNPDVSIFTPQMAAANRPGLTSRDSMSDVSESQRELIDLAFRLALIDIASNRQACTFLMETPESSLDGVAMERVGSTLRKFATKNSNRLIVTSNLSNSGMIASLFGGISRSKAELKKRKKRVLNLLEEAASNVALSESRVAYNKIFDQSLSGGS